MNTEFVIKCSVKRVKVTDTAKIALQSTIEQHHKSFCYPIRHVKMKSEQLNSGSSNFEFDNVFFGHVPNCLTLCTVENRSMYGVFKESPFHFKHSSSLIINIGNETPIRLDFDFANGQYVKAYNTLMRSTGQYKWNAAYSSSKMLQPLMVE